MTNECHSQAQEGENEERAQWNDGGDDDEWKDSKINKDSEAVANAHAIGGNLK